MSLAPARAAARVHAPPAPAPDPLLLRPTAQAPSRRLPPPPPPPPPLVRPQGPPSPACVSSWIPDSLVVAHAPPKFKCSSLNMDYTILYNPWHEYMHSMDSMDPSANSVNFPLSQFKLWSAWSHGHGGTCVTCRTYPDRGLFSEQDHVQAVALPCRRPDLQVFAPSCLRVFASSCLRVFASSRLRVFVSSCPRSRRAEDSSTSRAPCRGP